MGGRDVEAHLVPVGVAVKGLLHHGDGGGHVDGLAFGKEGGEGGQAGG